MLLGKQHKCTKILKFVWKVYIFNTSSAFFYFYSIIKCPLYVSSDTYHLFFPHQADTVSLEEIKNYIKQEVLKVFEGKKVKYYTTKPKSKILF